jgi:phage terminase large subunit
MAIIQFPKKLEPLFKTDKRYIAMHGGRDSGKSWGAAGKTILNAAQGKRCVCCREIASSIDESMHTLLINTIDRMKIAGFKITDRDFKHISGGYIFFKGLKGSSKIDSRTRIKSLEDVDWAWVEEAESMDQDTVQLFIPTIRKTGSQQCFTFNRYLPNDPIYTELLQNKNEKTTEEIIINYYDNPFCPKEEYDRAEKMKKDDYTLWLHIYGGEPINQDAQAIISRDKIQAAIDRDIEIITSPLIVGVDVARYGDDKTVFYGRKQMKMLKHAEYKKQSLTRTCDSLEQFVNFDSGNCILNIDDTGLGGGVSDTMQDRGYNVNPINFAQKAINQAKYGDIISEMWFMFADKIDQVELLNEQALKEELTTRLWKMDRQNRRCVEPKADFKKRLGHSPDDSDACVLCFYEGYSTLESLGDIT